MSAHRQNYDLMMHALNLAERAQRTVTADGDAIDGCVDLISRLEKRGPIEGAHYSLRYAVVLLQQIVFRNMTEGSVLDHHEATIVLATLVPIVKRHAGLALYAAHARPST